MGKAKQSNEDMMGRIEFLERNDRLAKENFSRRLEEAKEEVSVRERDLEIERKQRQRAEKKATELELRVMDLEKVAREVEEWRRADELRGKMDKEELQMWVAEERAKLEKEREKWAREVEGMREEARRREEKGRRDQQEQQKGMTDLVEKLNVANKERRRLEVIVKEFEEANVGLRKKVEEEEMMNNSQREEIGVLKGEMERLRLAYEIQLREVKDSLKMEREKREEKQRELDKHVEEIEKLKNRKHLTSLSAVEERRSEENKMKVQKEGQQTLDKKEPVYPFIRKEPSQKALEPRLSKVIINNEVVYEKDHNEHFSGNRSRCDQNTSMSSLNQIVFSNQKKKISLNDIKGPIKRVKYSFPREGKQLPYYSLNQSMSRGGRSVSPSPVRRIKLEDRKTTFSQQPGRGRKGQDQSSAEKRVLVRTVKPQTGKTRRVLQQSVRLQQAGREEARSDYYFVSGRNPEKKVKKVQDVLNQIKVNIETNTFKAKAAEKDKYEISELSSFVQSQIPKEVKQRPTEVFQLQMQGPFKAQSFQNLRPGEPPRITAKKVHTSPNFAKFVSPEASAKNRQRHPQRRLDFLESESAFASEEDEMEFNLKSEEDVNNRFEVFKKEIKKNLWSLN